MPGFSASYNRVGVSATGLLVGSTVVGFFVDGNEATMPMVFGVMPGEGDIPTTAIEQNTIRKDLLGPEPESAYHSKYPFNKVTETESGHVFEIDDTPNFERLHTFHRSGTYSEIDQSGRRVNKIVGDDFEIVQKDQNVFIKGNMNVKIKGNHTLDVDGNVDIKVGGSVNMQVGGNYNVSVNGSYNVNVNGGVAINGSTVNINNGTKGAARAGDLVKNDDNAGNQPIIGQSGTVLIGD